MAGLDTKKRFTVPHTYSECMWDGKPFLQVPHDGSDAGGRLASNGQRPRVLLNAYSAKNSLHKRITQTKKVNSAEVEKPGSWGDHSMGRLPLSQSLPSPPNPPLPRGSCEHQGGPPGDRASPECRRKQGASRVSLHACKSAQEGRSSGSPN